MKQILILLLCLSFVSFLKAQDANCNFICGRLEENNYPIVYDDNSIVRKLHIAYGKSGSNLLDPEYKNDFVGNGSNAKCNANDPDFPNPNDYDAVICNSDDPDYNMDDVLYYDVYYSTSYTQYQTCPLPCIIYFHGGGFSDCVGAGANVDFLRKLARRHFCCF